MPFNNPFAKDKHLDSPFNKDKPLELPKYIELKEESKEIKEEPKIEVKELRKEAKEVKVPEKTEKQKLREKHGGLISNIPINSRYWKM